MPLAGRTWAAAATLAAPALRLMLNYRLSRGREMAGRLQERFGAENQARPEGRLLWFHAASVGESLSVLPLLAALPHHTTTLFTTGTASSARLLAERLPQMGLSARVIHRFVPLDVPSWAVRFITHWRPDVACFVESELWPNLLEACRRAAIPTALVNARMSARSARAWSRVPALARDLLGGFALVAAQSEADAARLHALGAVNVVSWGDLKVAAEKLPADAAALAELSSRLDDTPRWLAASTHPADDDIVWAAHEQLCRRHAGLITAVAPRHPERGAALAERFGGSRRSQGALPPVQGGVWIADTIGELGLLYRCFPIVFMGKSFANGGGQNPWEPARLGCALATGPDTANFTEAVRTLKESGALRVLDHPGALTGWVDNMLSDPATRAASGQAALAATQAGTDLAIRLAERLVALMG